LDEFRRLEKNPPDIVISSTGPAAAGAFTLYGAPVNFTLIADSPDIAFAHKNGFMAKQKSVCFRCAD